MGSSCSSRQRLKDKDSNSTKSEESATYQVIGKKYSEEKSLITAEQKNHTGVINRSADSETKGGTISARNVASSVSDTISLPSPPTLSPRELTEPPLLQELTQLPESFQNFLTGRTVETDQSIKTRKIVLYVCAADSQDCCVEKGVLHEVVGPELRNYCRDKGYELHITDLHWKTDLETQYSHEFSELCVGELRRQMEVSYIIPVLFLSNSLGAPLLPKTVEAKNFEMALTQAEDKDILKKWYKLDPDSNPKCYELVPVSTHINGLKRNSLEQEEKLLQQWRNEAEKLLSSMVTSFSEELRNTCLSTVIEQELHNTIFNSQELARRCLWLYRVFTQRPEISQLSVIELEQKRRLEILYKELRSRLTEKHIVRINVKWNSDGVVDKNIPEHAQYISDVTSNLMKYLKATIFNIIEEDQSKAVIRSTYGIESSLLNELKWQNLFCQKLAARTLKRDSILQQIQGYVTSDSTSPLLLHGVQGSGKTVILCKAIHLLQTWSPDSYLLFRFAKISELSHSLIDILKSVCDHLSLLGQGHQTLCAYNLNNYGKSLLELISAIALQRSVIVVLDGLDHLKIADLDWLPHKLPNNAKLIVSASTDSFLFRQLKSKFQNERCVIQEVPELNRAEAESHFLSALSGFGGVVNKREAKLFLSFLDNNPLSLHVKVLAWRISWFFENEGDLKITNNSAEEINFLLDCIENILGKNRVTIALSIILASKYGLLDSELLDMLSHEPTFHSEKSHIKWAPAYLFISLLFKYLNIFFHWVSDGNYLTLKFNENTFEEIVQQRYVKRNRIYNELIQSYFKGIWYTEKNRSLAGKYLSQPNKTDKTYNKRKLVELPHQTILLKQNPVDEFFLNPKWLFDKICGCGVFQVLEDIVEYSVESRLSKDIETLKTILENTHEALNYDGRQMYTQFREELKHFNLEESLFWKSFYEKTEKPDTNSLMPVSKRMLLAGSLGQSPSNDSGQIPMVNINLIVRLIENPYFVVSVSTEKEEISVWDLSICEKVRCLKGVTHPISLQLIDDVRAVVLCRRELRIYNLDEGTLVTKLKGVMNQKMAYYGLHDKNHVVTLSRNRMYVNLMHLESGDCITTFKAGEDRFLNSLLVSGDGRILVCGDETQKPFPLLVWNLSSRKLLYDLRIPHHDFITSLSAITHEGHYVCCVAKEAVEPGPNFIVVYDLQNGTLFKKWKPGVDTTSLDISSKDSCVISGLADARILIWDLVTGNCRWSLRGHSAPVTLVRRDPCGGCFMSADILNRDRSIRLWDLNKGELLAVYTPPKPFSACELGIGGKVIALSLRGEDDLISLILKGPGIEPIENKSHYGKKENHGKTFTLTEGQDGS